MDEIQELAERLVERAIAEADTESEVLVDVEVDGYRCLVLRMDHSGIHRLSSRELEIARMVADGYSNKTIAAALDISSWTVNTYLRRIFEKLEVSSRAAMVAKLMVVERKAGARTAPAPDTSRTRPGRRR